MKDKIQVLERAFHVLEQIAQEGARPHTVGELAEESGLKVQTLSKIVRTLTLLGYLENTGRKNGYILGEKLLRLAESYRDPDMLRRLVRPYLKTYAEQIGEYICFSVLRGYYKRIVCKIRAKKANPRLQYTFPAEENAFESLSGIALVSRTPRARQIKFYDRYGTPPLWGKLSREEYLQKMEQTAGEEFSLSRELRPGYVMVCYPVICEGELLGELGTFMPEESYSEVVPELLHAIAGKIARNY